MVLVIQERWVCAEMGFDSSLDRDNVEKLINLFRERILREGMAMRTPRSQGSGRTELFLNWCQYFCTSLAVGYDEEERMSLQVL